MMALAILPPPIKAMCGTGASWEVVEVAELREAVIYIWREKEDGHLSTKNRKRLAAWKVWRRADWFAAIV